MSLCNMAWPQQPQSFSSDLQFISTTAKLFTPSDLQYSYGTLRYELIGHAVPSGQCSHYQYYSHRSAMMITLNAPIVFLLHLWWFTLTFEFCKFFTFFLEMSKFITIMKSLLFLDATSECLFLTKLI